MKSTICAHCHKVLDESYSRKYHRECRKIIEAKLNNAYKYGKEPEPTGKQTRSCCGHVMTRNGLFVHCDYCDGVYKA